MTDYTEIITTAQEAADPKPLDAGTIYAMLRDADVEIVDTDSYGEKPRRVTRRAIVRDAASFLGYLEARNAESLPGFEMWSDVDSRTVTGVLDGHDGWRGDVVVLQLEHSAEWKAWTKLSGHLIDQLAFADFIEDNLSSIADPDGSLLLEIVQSIQGSTKAQWQSADWLDNGARAFQWVEEVDAKAGRKGKLEIPSRFTLALRPFTGSDPFRVVANLRYRINQGILSIGFKLPELDRIIETAFGDVVSTIDSMTVTTILSGRHQD
jgi:uncharacterized protein YfdQ (DUF2303 family)